MLAQILNVQHSKSGTPTGAGAMLMERNSATVPLDMQLHWRSTAALGRPPWLGNERHGGKEVGGKGDVQVTESFAPKCTKDGIAELKVKLPCAPGQNQGEWEQNWKSCNHPPLSLRGMCKSVCVWRISSNLLRIGAEDSKSGSCQVFGKKPGKKELENEACSCWAATNKSSYKTKLLWQTCGVHFLNQGYLHE